jgi:small conductance mechanosensitive channel
VLQNRATISGWIAGPANLPADPRTASWRRLRRHLAETWHVFAIVYVLGSFFVYALQVAGGFVYLLRATALRRRF